PFGREQRLLRLAGRAERGCHLHPGNQGTGSAIDRFVFSSRSPSLFLSRRGGEEGLQRRRDLRETRARRSAHEARLETFRRRGALHRSALRQAVGRVVVRAIGYVGRGTPAIQVRGDEKAAGDL